jgi:hypothetical protein
MEEKLKHKKVVDREVEGIIEKAVEESEEIEELEPEQAEEAEETSLPSGEENDNGQGELSDAQMALFDKRELAKKIPGYGNLFHVEEEFLPESSRLGKQAIFGFAARDMQEETILNKKRKLSAWDIFRNRFMRYTISEDGQGRVESITLHQLSAEEKEAAAQGGLAD